MAALLLLSGFLNAGWCSRLQGPGPGTEIEWVIGVRFEWVAIGAYGLVARVGGPDGRGVGQELIAHRAGGAPAHRARSQLSSQHMSQSAEMSPK